MQLVDGNGAPLVNTESVVEVELEIPATFRTQLVFINHAGQYTTVEFGLPPGVYPNPQWMPKLLEGAYRNSLKTLKISTKDLSWRKPTPLEFVRATAGGQPVKVETKYAEPYESKDAKRMEALIPEVEAPEPEELIAANDTQGA